MASEGKVRWSKITLLHFSISLSLSYPSSYFGLFLFTHTHTRWRKEANASQSRCTERLNVWKRQSITLEVQACYWTDWPIECFLLASYFLSLSLLLSLYLTPFAFLQCSWWINFEPDEKGKLPKLIYSQEYVDYMKSYRQHEISKHKHIQK